MKKIVTNIKTAVVAIIGLIGGFIWAFSSNWQTEPTILLSVSAVELIAFAVLKAGEDHENPIQASSSTINQGNVSVNVNVSKSVSVREIAYFLAHFIFFFSE